MMTEAEWLACEDSLLMLNFLLHRSSDRKLRLFAVACCRRVWHLLTDKRHRIVVERAEQYADAMVSRQRMERSAERAREAGEGLRYCGSEVVGDWYAVLAAEGLTVELKVASIADDVA